MKNAMSLCSFNLISQKVIHPIEADCQARNLDKSVANKASNHHIDGTNTATTLVQYQ